ncbi:MAG: response regulator transcription factor [Coriobacteriales bacterium]|nr:response regulator transcription factor [Coriobacteriales bacterium]
MQRICIVEDDLILCRELAHLLELNGYECAACADFASAAAWIAQQQPSLAIIDLKLPGGDGLSICRDLRATSSVPILVLTSSDSEFDEVMSMNLGADDFLTKPYRPAVLVAHVQALLRRSGATMGRTVTHRGVTLNLATGRAAYADKSVELSRNEQRILDALMSNPGVIVTRQELMCELWDTDSFVDDNTLTVNVNRVRKALESLGAPHDFLLTKRGQGYMV